MTATSARMKPINKEVYRYMYIFKYEKAMRINDKEWKQLYETSELVYTKVCCGLCCLIRPMAIDRTTYWSFEPLVLRPTGVLDH